MVGIIASRKFSVSPIWRLNRPYLVNLFTSSRLEKKDDSAKKSKALQYVSLKFHSMTTKRFVWKALLDRIVSSEIV